MPVDLNLLIAFVLASAILVVIPGPVVMLVVANALTHGTAHGLRTLIGTASGTAVLLAAGGFGMTWIIAFLSQWFEVLRWAGAAYLVWLGVRTWCASPAEPEEASTKGRATSFAQGFVIAATNPKTLVFYAAFFPQFINPAMAIGPQVAILSVTFMVVATGLDAVYAVMCGRLRPWLTGRRRGQIRNRISGALLMGTGAVMAFGRHQ